MATSNSSPIPNLGIFTVFFVAIWVCYWVAAKILGSTWLVVVWCWRMAAVLVTKVCAGSATRRTEAAPAVAAEPTQAQAAQAAPAQAQGAQATKPAQAAPAQAAQPEPTAARTSEPQSQARAAERATVAEKTPESCKSGLYGSDLEIADRHALRKIGGRMFRFSYYREAGKVLRYDVKAKTDLPPFLRSTAASRKTTFGLEEAVEFTSWEIAVARSKKGAEKAPVKEKPAKVETPTQADGDADMRGNDEPPLPDEVPHWVQAEQYAVNEAPMAPTFSRETNSGLGEDVEAEKVIVEGDTDWENQDYQGVIVDQGIVKREPRGKKAYKIFVMTLQLPDGTTKEFSGVELNELTSSFRLRRGDTITIRKGVLHFTIVETDKREDRTKNVYSIKVIARALRRASNG